MAIKYGIFDNPPHHFGGSKGTKHVRIARGNILSTDALIDEIVSSTTFTRADVAGMLAALHDAMASHMLQGDSLQLDGIGTFAPRIAGTVVSDSLGRERGDGVHIGGVAFRPEKGLLKSLSRARFELEHTPHEVRPTDERIVEKLTEYFGVHASISSLQCSMCLVVPRGRAQRILVRLAAQGYLIPVGSSRNRSYIPAPGHLGR